MMKILILTLTSVLITISTRVLQATDEIKGTLTILQNKHNKDEQNKIYSTSSIIQDLKAGINTAQITNLGHLTIRVIVPQPSHGCKAFTLPTKFKEVDYPIYYLVIGGEGDCSYARKAELAKNALGSGVIIADSEKGINNLKLRMNEKDRFVTLLISEREGMTLAAKSPDFLAKLNMGKSSKEHKTQTNTMQIWISSLNEQSYRVLHSWRSVLKDLPILKDKLTWVPRFALYSCVSSQTCQSEFVSSCACGGEFCSPQQHSKSSDVLVREDIRQYLIFKESQEKFLSYIKKFEKSCLKNYLSTKYAQDCANGILHDLEIDSTINSKIDHFLTTCKQQQDPSNFKLYQNFALDRAKYTQIGHYPTIILNHQQLQFRNKEELRAQICRKLSLEQQQGCVHVSESTFVTKILSGLFYLVLIGLLLGAGAFVVIFFRNKLRRQMNKQLKMQVSTAVEHYFTLSQTH